MYKIRSDYTLYKELKHVLCPVSYGISQALDYAIEVITKDKKEFFGEFDDVSDNDKLNNYHVTYFFIEQGMVGAETKNHGVFTAENEESTIEQALEKYYSEETPEDKAFFKLGLKAEII